MKSEQIAAQITGTFADVVPKSSWGETAFFYNPGRTLPNGTYFCTLKEQDGANDQASNLNRDGVFRLSIGLSQKTYEELFGPRPPRPAKGGVVAAPHDFTALNTLMPHPVYAWMGWVQILCPSAEQLAALRPLLDEACRLAGQKFARKVRES